MAESSEADWIFLRDTMRTLDRKVKNGAVVVGQWDVPIPAERTGQAARDYLTAVAQRFAIVEEAVENALTSPLDRAQQAGRDVGFIIANGAKRAAKIARDIGHEAADTFKETADRMAKGGENVALGLGIGGAFALIVALLLIRELK